MRGSESCRGWRAFENISSMKIKVEQMPQSALRCGLLGVSIFGRSNVAEVVYAKQSPSSPASDGGDNYLSRASVDVLYHDEV